MYSLTNDWMSDLCVHRVVVWICSRFAVSMLMPDVYLGSPRTGLSDDHISFVKISPPHPAPPSYSDPQLIRTSWPIS
jgi:hypothetical protein